jgi:DNA-binding CsgD family transcriptional regulator
VKIAADCIGSAIQRERIRQTLLRTQQERAAELAQVNEELRQHEHEVQRSYRLLSTVAEVTKDLLENPQIDGEYFGCVFFDDCIDDRQWSTQEIDVLTSGAGAIGAALHRKQLVDRLVEERIRVEQERAAELAKANEALARTSSRLAEQPDLSAFLNHLMIEAMAQVGADGGHLTIYDKQRDIISTFVLIEDGKTIQAAAFPPAMPVEQVGLIQLIRQTRKLQYFNLDSNFEQDAHLFWTGVGEHHKRHKHVAGIAIPLYAGDEVLTTYDGDEDIYRGLQAGARGYLLKNVTRQELVEAIGRIHAGQKYIPAEVGARLADRMNNPQLTKRERQVLLLLTEGKSNQEIAAALKVSEGTIKFHVNGIFRKLGVSDRTQAVLVALKRGITNL